VSVFGDVFEAPAVEGEDAEVGGEVEDAGGGSWELVSSCCWFGHCMVRTVYANGLWLWNKTPRELVVVRMYMYIYWIKREHCRHHNVR